MITAIINTRNEEHNVGRAISSLNEVADEIIVADMASSDDTVKIALQLGARIIEVPNIGFVEPARKLAVSAASHEWILLLDADEIVAPGLGTQTSANRVRREC